MTGGPELNPSPVTTPLVAPKVAALLLAAGASSRLGELKQLLRDTDGTPVITRLAASAVSANLSPVVVVLGSNATAVRESLRGLPVQIVENAEWQHGMATSIHAGLRALAAEAVQAVVLMACDQPAVTTEHLQALLARFVVEHSRVASSYANVHGIPAVWPRADWPAMMALTGDRGARALFNGTEVTVPLAHGELDLDTPQDLAAWRAIEHESH